MAVVVIETCAKTAAMVGSGTPAVSQRRGPRGPDSSSMNDGTVGHLDLSPPQLIGDIAIERKCMTPYSAAFVLYMEHRTDPRAVVGDWAFDAVPVLIVVEGHEPELLRLSHGEQPLWWVRETLQTIGGVSTTDTLTRWRSDSPSHGTPNGASSPAPAAHASYLAIAGPKATEAAQVAKRICAQPPP